jgi:hypothetical protein
MTHALLLWNRKARKSTLAVSAIFVTTAMAGSAYGMRARWSESRCVERCGCLNWRGRRNLESEAMRCAATGRAVLRSSLRRAFGQRCREQSPAPRPSEQACEQQRSLQCGRIDPRCAWRVRSSAAGAVDGGRRVCGRVCRRPAAHRVRVRQVS